MAIPYIMQNYVTLVLEVVKTVPLKHNEGEKSEGANNWNFLNS